MILKMENLSMRPLCTTGNCDNGRVSFLYAAALAIVMACTSSGCQKNDSSGFQSVDTSLATITIDSAAATCSVQGWASQNGGVTGGGTTAVTVVSTYEALKAAIQG